jgi:DNA-binding CsgD family transcriptional regulator
VSASVLVGRQPELERIDALLAQARSGHGSAVVVVGDPGIGKTALLAAARERADGMRVAAAAGVESEARLPFAALGEIAEPFLDELGELPDPQAAAIAGALALAPPSEESADRLAIAAGFLALLRTAAADGPVLTLVDDAHWLDAPSAECLGYAARRLADCAVLFLAAVREEEGQRAFTGRMIGELRLSGLDRDDALVLLRASTTELARPAAEAVIDVAVGNPLALLELPGLMSEDQRRGLAPLGPAPAPGGALGAAFERRVDVAGAEARAALLVAAASMDRELTPVVSACRQLGIDERGLERAESARLLELAADQFSFAHPLLRGVVYGGATPAERRRVHRALADHTPEDSRPWHLAAATIGPDEQVAEALEAVAHRATARGAHSTAADAFERAARATADPGTRSRHLLRAAGAAGLGAAYDRAASLLETVTAIDEPVLRARIRHLLGLVTLVGGTRDAIANNQMLTEEADRVRDLDASLAATLHADAGVMAVVGGDSRLALASAERAMAMLPEAAEPGTRCQVLSILGMGLGLCGRASEAREAFDRAGELLPNVHPLTPTAQSVSFALHARICTGQEEVLRREALSFGSTGRDAGTVGLLPHYLMVAADAAYRLGDWEGAARDADEAIETADDSGQRGPLSIALVVRARLHAAVGEEAAARSAAERGIAVAEPIGYSATAMWARAALGFLELGVDRPGDAIVELEESGRLARNGGLEDPIIVPWASDLVEAYARAGRHDDARRIASDLTQRAKASGVPLALALAERCEGLLAEDEFERRFERALELHEQAGAPFERGRTLLALGSRLHRARRRVAARDQLRAAREIFERLGAQPWVDRTRAELSAAGAIDRVPVADPDELTAQEVRVAEAVARGATNKQVAAELFLSPKTIEFHLGRVYRKLGIHSRTELATLVAEGRLEAERPSASAGG